MARQISSVVGKGSLRTEDDGIPSVRDRLLQGPQNAYVTDRELLGFLAGPAACSYIAEAGRSLKSILTADPAELVHALPEGEIAALLAARELLRRISCHELPDRDLLGHPAAVARYLVLRFWKPDQEVMGALYLDTRNRLLSEAELFRGTLNRAAAEPRAILKEGLLRGAAGVILFHTHPSGDPSPSAEDLAFTRRLSEAGEIVGVRLVDHLVLAGPATWVSLRQRGAW